MLIAMGGESIPAINAEQFYVSVSRGRESAGLYSDLSPDELRQAIQRSDSRKSATELMGRPLQTTAQKPETVEAEDLGPCASRPMPKAWTGLYVLNGKEDTRAFQYVHLGFASYSASGTSFVVEFNVPEKWKLTVKGRKLWKVSILKAVGSNTRSPLATEPSPRGSWFISSPRAGAFGTRPRPEDQNADYSGA